MFLTLNELLQQSLIQKSFPTLNDEPWRFNELTPYLSLPFELESDVSFQGVFDSRKKVDLHFQNFHLEQKGLPQGCGVKKKEDFKSSNNIFLDVAPLDSYEHWEINAEKDNELVIQNDFSQGIFCTQKRDFHVSKGKKLKIIDIYESDCDSFIALDMKIVLEEGARFQYIRINLLDKSTVFVSTSHAEVRKKANYLVNSYTHGSGLSHETFETTLAKKSKMELFALVYATQGQKNTIVSHVHHQENQGISDQQAKEILASASQAVFDTTSTVDQGTQHCEVNQNNAALLLDDSAQIHSKPHLKIYTDTLVAQHGSTVGSLDEDARFYLQSRGLSEVAANALLIDAFASVILEKIDDNELIEAIKADMEMV